MKEAKLGFNFTSKRIEFDLTAEDLKHYYHDLRMREVDSPRITSTEVNTTNLMRHFPFYMLQCFTCKNEHGIPLTLSNYAKTGKPQETLIS